MADEDINDPQNGDDGFPSFLKSSAGDEQNEYTYEYVEVPEDEAAAAEKTSEEEKDFDLNEMLGGVSDDVDLPSAEEDILLSPEYNGNKDPALQDEADTYDAGGQDISKEEMSVEGDKTENVSETVEAEVIPPEVVEPLPVPVEEGESAEDGSEFEKTMPEMQDFTDIVENAAVPSEAVGTAESLDVAAESESTEDDVAADPVAAEKVSDAAESAFILMSGLGIQAVDLAAYDGAMIIDGVVTESGNSWFWLERRQNLKELPSGSSQVNVELPVSGANFITLVKGGEQKLEMFNRRSVRVEDAGEEHFKAVEGDFILGSSGFDSGLIVEEFRGVNLADVAEDVLIFSEPVAGIICGPGVVALVNGLKKLSWSKVITDSSEKEQLHHLKWYSGGSDDKYFEVDGTSVSSELVGNAERNSIHINCGGTTYGWNVHFNNGIAMSLRDLREYQIKYGRMPDGSGVIVCGDLQISFTDMVRIVVYETAQYFTYRRSE